MSRCDMAATIRLVYAKTKTAMKTSLLSPLAIKHAAIT